MLLWKRWFLTTFVLCTSAYFIDGQEYLKELHKKEVKFDIKHELPTVEVPKPLFNYRNSRSKVFEHHEDLLTENKRKLASKRPTLIDIALAASVKEGLNAMQQVYGLIEPNMLRNGHILDGDHPAALLSKFSAPTTESKHREMAAFATISATKAFWKSYNLNNDLARQAHSQKVSLRRTALESLCPPRDAPACMPASERYRTHDGTCNNKRRPRWGTAQMPFTRFLPPVYGDGVDSVRQSVAGGQLSSSRFVSLLVHGARDGEAPLTLMLAQWGQLLDHDLTSTAQPRSINGSVPSCCGNNDFHPSCFPIKVPLDDPWLSPLKVRCLEFLRSAPAQRRDCVLSWREQTNQATSFIDASPIYSNSVKSADNARVFQNGLLIFGRGNPNDDNCQRGAVATHCVRSGDGRSGEQPGLLALHHVWVGEHNRIAMRLSEMNLHWSDEKIYQETRKIVGAMFQHITYREFLPIVLGREVTKLFDLELLSTGYYEGYDAKTNPGVANSFSAAAFRFGHSLVQNSYTRCDRFHNVLANNVSLHEEFQRGDIGSAGSLHRLIRGMANQRALKRDEFITPELTNHLFQTPGFPFGLDLAAINIQRGRDHGIPSYTSWRVPCGLSAINTWEEFANVVGPESAKRISHAYQNVHDIDLFVGGIAERPVIGGLVGPTFACIIAQQFSNSRRGDRFWYENGRMENSFTPAQLHSIRRVTLASVLCRSVGGGTFQPHIFLPSDMPNNERQPCGVGTLANLDLDPWMEQDPFTLQQHTDSGEASMAINLPSKVDESQSFGPPTLDRIFDVVPTNLKTHFPDSNKLDNGKFTNQRPFEAEKLETVIPHSSPGFHRAKNFTKINDKLDFKRKGNVGHITKQKPLPGVNNKLEKHSRRGVNRPENVQTTTRKTIIVNNIPIELRNADRKESRTESIDNIFVDKDNQRKSLHPKSVGNISETITEVKGLENVAKKINLTYFLIESKNISSIKKSESNGRFKKDNQSRSRIEQKQISNDQKQTNDNVKSIDLDIDPMTNPPVVEHKRVQRKNFDGTPSKLITKQLSLSESMALLKANVTVKKHNGTIETNSLNQLTRLPLGNSELRQNQHRPSYTNPPKVIVDAGNGDNQYQIEINIRQSNKRPTTPQSALYDDLTSKYPTNPYDRYTPSYANIKTTTPLYALYHPSPTQLPLTNKKTKPPTIIFINEHNYQASTTRQPGFVHSIVEWSTVGRKPFPSDQTPMPGIVSSLSQTHLSGGVVQATSQAVSHGQYGIISGFASANGGDSTFSFNIRPKPDQTLVNKPELSGNFAFTYPPSKTWYSKRPQYGEHIAPYDLPYREGTPSPFSSSNPQPYYTRKKTRPHQKEEFASYKDSEFMDYDYLNKARNPLKNSTSLDYLELGDAEYDEDYGNSPLFKKFNRDGYLRPEHMIRNIMRPDDKQTNASTNNVASTSFASQTVDDNYVLPAMNSTQGILKKDFIQPGESNFSVNFPDSQSKQLNRNIFAEEPQEFHGMDSVDPSESDKLKEHMKRILILKQAQKKIPFAPIKILTKPERPDNWVIYDSIKGDPALPQVPDVKMDISPSSEIPRPFRENFWFNTQLNLQPEESFLNENKTDALIKGPQNVSTKTLLGNRNETVTNNATATPTNLNMTSSTDSGTIQDDRCNH